MPGTGRDLRESETETLRPQAAGRIAPLPQSRPSNVRSRCASPTPRAMASNPCPSSPLLVRVSEPGLPLKLHRKLETYFQSRQSGGGECTVRALGPSAPGTYQVEFLDRAGEPQARGAGAKVGPGAQPRGVPGRPVRADLGERAGESMALSGRGTETGGTCCQETAHSGG